jgi:integrase
VLRVLGAFEREKGPAARDRALLLLGLDGGYRMSELASLNAEDVGLADKGAVVLLRKSKTDQAGEGFHKGIRCKRSICVSLSNLARNRWVSLTLGAA